MLVACTWPRIWYLDPTRLAATVPRKFLSEVQKMPSWFCATMNSDLPLLLRCRATASFRSCLPCPSYAIPETNKKNHSRIALTSPRRSETRATAWKVGAHPHVCVEGVERHPSGAGGRLPGDDAGAPPDVLRQRPAQQRPAEEQGRERGAISTSCFVLHGGGENGRAGAMAYLLGSVAQEEAGADSLSERSHASYDEDGGGSSSLPLGPTNTGGAAAAASAESSFIRSCSGGGGATAGASLTGFDSSAAAAVAVAAFTFSSFPFPIFLGPRFSFSADAGPRLAVAGDGAAGALLLRGRSGSLLGLGVVVPVVVDVAIRGLTRQQALMASWNGGAADSGVTITTSGRFVVYWW